MATEFTLIESSAMEIIIPLLMELDPDIPEPRLRERLPEMLDRGYECIEEKLRQLGARIRRIA